ncbi:MAG TPA: chorismate synthase [Candidatus Polarisedimenticolia bacterium]|nr:chorismate synthase [Candidatus Polarisedimenticolia bacterium]
MFRFLTAGESHGPALTVIVDGLPAGLEVTAEAVDRDLRRRQAGYGRGGRMAIEHDAVRVTGGVRLGRTIGGPVSMVIENRDYPAWTEAMSAGAAPKGAGDDTLRRVRRPRPGHADLAGSLKHDTHDARDVLERASARETTARVAAGGLARLFLERLGVAVASHTLAVGTAAMPLEPEVPWDRIVAIPSDSPMRCADAAVEKKMVAEVDRARAAQDSVGGVFQVVAAGVPAGLGSYRQWDTRLEARLGQALLSIHAVKAVEIGEGVASASRFGSRVHDAIGYDPATRRFTRPTNRAGGIEGGMTNGQEVRATAYLKPLSTLPRPLDTVDLIDKSPAQAVVERTDTCVVPAAGVIGESMTAIVLAEAFLEKFGGDSMTETARNLEGYLAQLEGY